MNPASDNTVTIMKFKSPDGVYDFKCLDRFNEPDEAKRLDQMIQLQNELVTQGYEVLWIKTLPIFDIH